MDVLDKTLLPRHIEIRIKNIDDVPTTVYERGRKLKSLKVTKEKLISWGKQCEKDEHDARAARIEAETQLQLVLDKIVDIETNSDKGPVVSEHSIVRYLERYKGVNLQEIAKEIADLPAENKLQSGVTIVTVYPPKSD